MQLIIIFHLLTRIHFVYNCPQEKSSFDFCCSIVRLNHNSNFSFLHVKNPVGDFSATGFVEQPIFVMINLVLVYHIGFLLHLFFLA